MRVPGGSRLALVSGQSPSQWHGASGTDASGDGRTCPLSSGGMLSCPAVVSWRLG